MKRFIIILMFFLLFLFLMLVNRKEDVKPVMSNIDINNHYVLNFDDEILNLRNFKLKLGLFTSYNYNITKVYFRYPEKIKEYFYKKEYFSFDNSDFNKGIEKLKKEYNLVLEHNYLYDELEKDINDVQIDRVELYCDKDALTKFKNKYPNVKIEKINK